MAKDRSGNWIKKLRTYDQVVPAQVAAVQFKGKGKKFLDFEGLVRREPGAGADRDDQGRFVFTGSDGINWTVNDGDYIVFVEYKVFPSYFVEDRGHSFVMSENEFKANFQHNGEVPEDEPDDSADTDETPDDEEEPF